MQICFLGVSRLHKKDVCVMRAKVIYHRSFISIFPFFNVMVLMIPLI